MAPTPFCISGDLGDRPFVQALLASDGHALVQAKDAVDRGDVHAAAERGIADTGSGLPHTSTIQASFGTHDVSDVKAHIGGAAANACGEIGASAYATGNDVAFWQSPTLHTAAHEAAHVVQQRSGVSLEGGVGKSGDAYELHADAVADAVVAGQSAEGLLDGMLGQTPANVQRLAVQRQEPGETKPTGQGNAAAIKLELDRAQRKLTSVGGIYDRRKDAVQRLITDLDSKGDEPNLGIELLETAATTALAIATGGIGGAVAATIASKVVTGLAQATQDKIKVAVSGQLQTLVGHAAKKVVKSTTPSRGDFFETQVEAINSAAQVAGDALAKRRTEFTDSADSLEQATALADGYAAQTDTAFDRQYLASVAEWSELVNRSSMWTDRSQRGMDTTASGILGIDVDYADPGAKLNITGAHLEDIPEDVRKRMGKMGELTIGDVCGHKSGMTVRVIQEYKGGYLMGTVGTKRTRVALESRPSARGQVCEELTGNEGIWILERGRKVYNIPIENQDYKMVPVVAAIIWAHEIAPLTFSSLPGIED